MPAYTIYYNGESKTTQVHLVTEPSHQEWSEIMDSYQQKTSVGWVHWDLDMRKLDFIGSHSLGMVVSLNTCLTTRGGSLRLVMTKDSKIANLIQLTKLDRIINVVNL